MTATPAPTEATRPRIAGEREEEILDATAELLLEVGYERLTMDAAAHRARASKATLYRRWESKSSLVVDALLRSKTANPACLADTGSLRGDLIALLCPSSSQSAVPSTDVIGCVLTALQTDAEFAAEFRARILAPKLEAMRTIYRRAADRGDLAPGVDPELLGPALAGIVLHRKYVLGEQVNAEVVARVLDQIILPAATGRHPSPTSPQENA